MTDVDDYDDRDYDTEPFCRHWGDPGECEEICANCAHFCRNHHGDCPVEGCRCLEFDPGD